MCEFVCFVYWAAERKYQATHKFVFLFSLSFCGWFETLLQFKNIGFDASNRFYIGRSSILFKNIEFDTLVVFNMYKGVENGVKLNKKSVTFFTRAERSLAIVTI